MRVATIKVHGEASRERKREKRNGQADRGERSRKTILLRDAAMSYISEKITALESDPRLWKLFAARLLSLAGWLPPAISRPLDDQLPRSVLAGKLCARSCEIPFDARLRRALNLAGGRETREISELSTNFN